MHKSDAWKQAGSISLWRYAERDRNYPGWHFSADRPGSESFAALLDVLVADGPGQFRTIVLSHPRLSVLPDKYKSGGLVSPQKLRVSVSATPSTWPFSETGEASELSIGTDWVAPLRQGVLGVHCGETDYSIGPRGRGSVPLWFW